MSSALTVSTPSDRELCVTRAFAAPRTLVFDCWTKQDLVKQWLTGPPGWSFATCTIDLKVGGQYRFVWKDQGGNVIGLTGTFREIARPGRLVSTELFDQDWTGGETRVTILLTEDEGVTTMKQTIFYSSKAARDGAAGSGMTHGMEMGFQKLAEFLEKQKR
jgi:uncharacterized protein YndB with AHSA1/START domain